MQTWIIPQHGGGQWHQVLSSDPYSSMCLMMSTNSSHKHITLKSPGLGLMRGEHSWALPQGLLEGTGA